MARVLTEGEKPLDWVGSSKRDFLSFPEPVKDEMGNALGLAQFGGKHPSAKPWKGAVVSKRSVSIPKGHHRPFMENYVVEATTRYCYTIITMFNLLNRSNYGILLHLNRLCVMANSMHVVFLITKLKLLHA